MISSEELSFFGVLTLPWLLTALTTFIFNKKRIAIPIILLSLVSAPFFDFLAPYIGVPFLGGGCGGMLISPILALIISLITGVLGWVIGRIVVPKTQSKLIKNIGITFIGTFSGFIAGILAALIFAPMAC